MNKLIYLSMLSIFLFVCSLDYDDETLKENFKEKSSGEILATLQ